MTQIPANATYKEGKGRDLKPSFEKRTVSAILIQNSLTLEQFSYNSTDIHQQVNNWINLSNISENFG